MKFRLIARVSPSIKNVSCPAVWSSALSRNYAEGFPFRTFGRVGPPHPNPLPKERVDRLPPQEWSTVQ